MSSPASESSDCDVSSREARFESFGFLPGVPDDLSVKLEKEASQLIK